MLEIHITCDGCGASYHAESIRELTDIFSAMMASGWRLSLDNGVSGRLDLCGGCTKKQMFRSQAGVSDDHV